ncbi:MAG: hypothetical protein GX640_05600, partial [Fibrobacter sp.]|nr:hypothetical protein [Fibrobacter sp.]
IVESEPVVITESVSEVQCSPAGLVETHIEKIPLHSSYLDEKNRRNKMLTYIVIGIMVLAVIGILLVGSGVLHSVKMIEGKNRSAFIKTDKLIYAHQRGCRGWLSEES